MGAYLTILTSQFYFSLVVMPPHLESRYLIIPGFVSRSGHSTGFFIYRFCLKKRDSQCRKHWPVILEVPGSIPATGEEKMVSEHASGIPSCHLQG